MRRFLQAMLIVLCACGFSFTAASATLDQVKQKSDTRQPGVGSTQTQSPTWALLEARKCKQGCHDCWYKFFPGAVNYCLGMRDWGKGSYQSGLQLLQLAASWGNKNAQYTLGMIYFNGHHVAPDRARGIAWLMLANQRHNDAHTDLVTRSVVHLATPEQNKRAQRLFQEMRKKYGDKVAGTRAWRHLRNRLKGATVYAKNSCITEGGDVVPWSSGFSADPHMLCMPSGQFGKSVAKIATKYFDGLTGTVSVGPLQQVPAPATSSSP